MTRFWGVIGTVVLLLLTGAAVLAACRSIARGRRRYVRLGLLGFRASEDEPDQVRRLLGAWHQDVVRRWDQRLVLGQPGIALEIATTPGAEADRATRLSIVCPDALAPDLERTLLGCYPDSRLVRDASALPPVDRVIRCKKRNAFAWTLQRNATHDGRNVMDTMLAQMSRVPENTVVQLTLTPTPAVFDRRRHGSGGRITDGSRPSGPARREHRSTVMVAGLQGGLSVDHGPRFFVEIRVAATTLTGARAIAEALRAASGAENELVAHALRPWGRTRLYLRRLERGIGNPLPAWKRGALSTTELSALWQAPTRMLEGMRSARSPLPRMLAAPEISRAPEHALARDQRGLVGIPPEDMTYGLALIGGQKTGKTSLLCRTVRADAVDPGCAVVVLMPKSGDATAALSTVPPNRTVHYLDLEQPEMGFNPLLGGGEPAMIADGVVEALRSAHADDDIRGSSDRYLRLAAQASIAAGHGGVDGTASLWHMYRLLLPGEVSFRERVVKALHADARFADAAAFFGHELPAELNSARSRTLAKLEVPRNKLLRVTAGSLDRVLRHPVQLSLDEIVRRREVLIVDGKMGALGTDNCRVIMQFLLIGLYSALQRQQRLPESERVRVAVKVDEAHVILTGRFADATSKLRSSGLEMVAAWQEGERIQDTEARDRVMSLLRHRCVFSMGGSRHARELSESSIGPYTALIPSDGEPRAQPPVTRETIINLSDHDTVCSWIRRGVRVPAFIAHTLPLEREESVIERHLAAQRDRAAHVPARLPDPMPDIDWDGLDAISEAEAAALQEAINKPVSSPARGEPASAVPRRGQPAGGAPPTRGNGKGPAGAVSERAQSGRDSGPAADHTVTGGRGRDSGPAADHTVTGGRGGISAPDAGDGVDPPLHSAGPTGREPEVAEHRPPGSPPDGYVELDLDDVRGITWEKPRPLPPNRRPEPTARDLEILAALWSYRTMFANQIWRRWWGERSARAAQQGLKRMTEAGWVRRFKFQLADQGAQQRVYCLTKEGFELVRGKYGRRGVLIPEDETWREPQITDPRRVLRDLHVNGWVLALEQVAGPAFEGWRGPRESRLHPPRRKVRGDWVDLRPADIVLGSNHRLRDAQCTRLEPVSPDATVELRIPALGQRSRLDVLVELDRSRGSSGSEERLRRYDVFIAGWSHLLPRYRTLGTPPVVVFVSEDERALLKLLGIADAALTTRIAKAGTDELEWPFPGRCRILFAVERDLHEGSLRAIALPEHPPALRVRLNGPDGKVCRPQRVHIVDPRLLQISGPASSRHDPDSAIR